jgi:hypothetical protein
MVRDSRAVSVDAILLKFVRRENEVFPFVRYQRMTDLLRSKAIVAYGFPGHGVGGIFQTEGTIAQTNIDERGTSGTSVLQSSGMSGGPVLLKESGNLIGIAVGADFDPNTGVPASFAVLATQEVASIFEFALSSSADRSQQSLGVSRLAQVPNLRPEPPGASSSYVPQYEGLLREALIAVAGGNCPPVMSALLRATCDQQMPELGRFIRLKGTLVSNSFPDFNLHRWVLLKRTASSSAKSGWCG